MLSKVPRKAHFGGNVQCEFAKLQSYILQTNLCEALSLCAFCATPNKFHAEIAERKRRRRGRVFWMAKRRIFAGEKLKALRTSRGFKQAEFAARLGISVSYLSQLEHDDRPLTPALLETLARDFPLDWEDFEEDAATRRFAALREAAADPLFPAPLSPDQLARIAEQQPQLADQFIALHQAYLHAGQRLQIVDEAISADNIGGARLPWEEVRDWFHNAGNYVDALDRAAEALGDRLRGRQLTPGIEGLELYLRNALSISLIYAGSAGLRDYDAEMGHLVIDQSQPAESQRFQLAHQLAALALRDEISRVVEGAGLRSPAARQLLSIGLANYAAGAVLMPYAAFRAEARSTRHDIDRLRQQFSVSFEQTCHRLSTLQRPGARGVPFFFCRVDMAGNITKRHSATRLQFARFGGACPLWIVHEAVAIPDRILVQLAETPDGVRYVSMAKGLVKPSGSYDRSPRRYAVALGCEIDHAREFIYADGLTQSQPTQIGISCRLCPRPDCDQRAFPPSDRDIIVDPDRRSVVPYRIA
jgi:XRE family transcriptional regulator, fatty acid utilization regulator